MTLKKLYILFNENCDIHDVEETISSSEDSYALVDPRVNVEFFLK